MRFNIFAREGKRVDEHFNVNSQQGALIFAPKKFGWLGRLLHQANETQQSLSAQVEIGNMQVKIETVHDS